MLYVSHSETPVVDLSSLLFICCWKQALLMYTVHNYFGVGLICNCDNIQQNDCDIVNKLQSGRW